MLGVDYTGLATAPTLTSGAWLLPNTLVTSEVRPNYVTVEGSDGSTATAIAADNAVGLGQIGEYVTYSYVLDATTLQDIADTRLANNIQTVAASIEVAADAHWRPFIDYYVGDIVWVDVGSAMPAGWYRVEKIAGRLTNESEGFRYVVDVGRAVVTEQAAVADKLARILEAGLIDLETGLVTASSSGQASTTIVIQTDDVPAHTHVYADVSGHPVPGGDITGSLSSVTVNRVRGYEHANDPAPAGGDSWVWHAANDIAEWRPRWTYDTAANRAAAVAADLRDGDVWVDTDDDSIHVWDAGGTAWVAISSGAQSPLTTKGDLWGFDTVDDRVPVGSNGQVLTADSTAGLGVAWSDPPSSPQAYTYQFALDGTLATGTGVFRIPIWKSQEIVGVRLAVNTAPTGQALIVDLNIDGITAYTTQGNRPTVAAGANDSGTVTLPDVTVMNAGSYLTVDIDQIGSGTAGADATLIVVCEETTAAASSSIAVRDRQWSSVTSASTTLTATLPTTRLPGDLLVVFVTTDDNETFTDPTGWTRIRQTTRNNSTCYLMCRKADGTESSTVNITIGTAAKATIHAWSITGWFDTGNLADAFDSVGTQTSGFNIDPPPVTPRWARAESLAIGGGGDAFARTVSGTPGNADYADWELSDLNQSTGAPLAAIAEVTATTTVFNFSTFTHANDTDVSSFAVAIREVPPPTEPTFVGVDGITGTQGSSTTLNVDVPAGTADGDLMVMFVQTRGGRIDNSEMTTTRGWTEVFNLAPTDTSGVSESTGDGVSQVYTKVASGEGATTPVDFIYAFGSGGYTIRIASYRNAEVVTSDWLDPTVSDTVAPSLTGGAIGDMLVCWYFTEFAQFDDFDGAPSGMVYFVADDTELSRYYCGQMVAQKRLTAAGATGTQEITGVNNFCGAGSILLRTP